MNRIYLKNAIQKVTWFFTNFPLALTKNATTCILSIDTDIILNSAYPSHVRTILVALLPYDPHVKRMHHSSVRTSLE